MLLHKTTDYMKVAKETTMMEFKTQEELNQISSPRYVRQSVRPPVRGYE